MVGITAQPGNRISIEFNNRFRYDLKMDWTFLKIKIHPSFVLLILLALYQVNADFCRAEERCSSELYNEMSFAEPKQRFSPLDKVYILITCPQVAPGSHTIHVNWIHEKLGVVRSDKNIIAVEQKSDQSVYFWMSLLRRGPFSSMFSGDDYYEDHYGNWTVEGYLDEGRVTSSQFVILE